MNTISIAADFDDREDFRLLAMDAAWVGELKQRMDVQIVQPCKRPRQEGEKTEAVETVAASGTQACHSPSVLLVMKGTGQLCASNAVETLLVRRVEYSNTLLIAERHLCDAEAAAPAADSSGSAEALRDRAKSVVVTALARLFEAHRASPQQNAMETLRDSVITIEELEGLHGPPGDPAFAGRRFTFQDLAVANSASPRELAAVLRGVGAVVHKGYVRLLDPALLQDALRAVLRYFDAAEPSELSWPTVERHFCPDAFPSVVMGAVRAVYGTDPQGGAADVDGVQGVGVDTLLDVPKVVIGLAAHVFESSAEARTINSPQATLLPHGIRDVSMPFEDFFGPWLDSVPPSLFGTATLPLRTAPAEHLLATLGGYVICHRQRRDSLDGSTVWWLPRDTLPNDVPKRLDVLFAIHDGKYAAAVLQPYVEPLLGPDQGFAHAILRYAREYRVPGEPVTYSRLAA